MEPVLRAAPPIVVNADRSLLAIPSAFAWEHIEVEMIAVGLIRFRAQRGAENAAGGAMHAF